MSCGTCDAGEDCPIHGGDIELKTCSKCGLEKPVTEFSVSRRKQGRVLLRSACKRCLSASFKEWHSKTKPPLSAAEQARKAKKKPPRSESTAVTTPPRPAKRRTAAGRLPTATELAAWYRQGCRL